MSMSQTDESAAGAELNGARILIVEDEYYLAEDLAAAFTRAGALVIGPAGSLRQAEAPLADGGLDGAVLDMNLRGEHAFALAERLQAADVPFVIVSGYSAEALPASLVDVPRLEKPIDTMQVVKAIAGLRAGRSG